MLRPGAAGGQGFRSTWASIYGDCERIEACLECRYRSRLTESISMRTIWRTLVAATALLVGPSSVLPTSGAEFRSGEEVVVAADETIKGDLYAFGRHITVDGTVEGDLVAFGE